MNTVVAKRVTDVVELELLDDADTSTERQAPAAPTKAENGSEREQAEVHPWRKGTDASSFTPKVRARQTTFVTSKDDALPAAPPNESVEAVSKAVNERESALENNGTDSAVAPVDPLARLAELGMGRPNAAALRPHLEYEPVTAVQDRLDQNLAQAIVDRDRDRSVGVEGPITTALHTGAIGTIAPRSLSKIAVIIGHDGKLAEFRIIETNREARGLYALSERVKTLLANRVVRVPSGRAMEFVYELESEVLLPSGRAPGLGVEVFGIPIKEAEEKSSKLSFLTPKLKFESLAEPDPERNGKVTQTPPQIGISFSLVGLDVDLVDIAAPERQVVRVRLLQQRVL